MGTAHVTRGPDVTRDGPRLRLLGPFCLETEDGEVARLDSSRAEAVLGFLALHEGPVPRDRLAGTFWPDSAPGQARTNLRKALHTLRQVPGLDDYVEITARSAAWRADAPCAVDVAEFDRIATDGAADLTALRAAAELYRGDLLASLDDPWSDGERTRLRGLHAAVLRRLATACADAADLPGAVSWARRAVAAEPLEEEGYRLLMRFHLSCGERALALAAFHDCSSTLERELGVPPSPATLAAYAELLPHDDAAPGPTTPRPSFVGRGAERARLGAAWASAAGGVPVLVVVSGEAGIGKTRLTEEFYRWCARRGGVVARGRCHGTEGHLAYAPVAAWLREPALGVANGPRPTPLSRLVPELAGAGGRQEPEPLAEDERRRLLHEAVAAAVLDRPGTVVVLGLEDLQHADGETCDVVRHLLGVDPPARLLLVATVRSEDLPDDGPASRLLRDLRRGERCLTLDLGPLDRTETLTLARSLGAALDDAAAHSLHGRTGGNPLFVVEAVRATAQGGGEEISPRVQAVIESRLAALRPATRTVLDVAALLGREFDADVLADAAHVPEDVLVTCLDELWRRRIVRDLGAGGYDFAHDTIRTVAAEGVDPARRRVLHRAIAAALERRHGPTLEAAVQHELAGQPGPAATAFRTAAESAQDLGAQAQAAALLDRALVQLRRLPPSPHRDCEELDVHVARLAPLSSAHGYAAPQLRTAQRRATELTEALGLRPAPELLRSSAMSALTRGDYASAAAGGRAIHDAGRRSGQGFLLVEGAFVLGVTRFWQARFLVARAHLEEAVERYRPGDRRGHLVHYGNDPKVSCLARLGNTWWFLGDPAAAQRASDAALDWATEIAHPYSLGIAAFFGALLAIDTGDEDALRRLAAVLGTAPSPQLSIGGQALRGHLAVLDGAPAHGLRTVRAAVAASAGQEAPGLPACLTRVLLAAELAAGDAAAARQTAERLLTMGRGAQVWAVEARRVREVLG